MAKTRKPPQDLPTRQQILDFIAASDEPAGKREIARAFGLKGQDRVALKALLRDMGDEGLIDAGPGRAFHRMGGIPKVTVLRVVDVDDSGVGLPPGFDPAHGTLGLSIVTTLVESELGGEITPGSAQDGGARISLRIPLGTRS